MSGLGETTIQLDKARVVGRSESRTRIKFLQPVGTNALGRSYLQNLESCNLFCGFGETAVKLILLDIRLAILASPFSILFSPD